MTEQETMMLARIRAHVDLVCVKLNESNYCSHDGIPLTTRGVREIILKIWQAIAILDTMLEADKVS